MSKERISVDECKRLVHELDEALVDEEEETFKAAVLFWYGTANKIRNTAFLVMKTGYDRNFVHRIKKNLTKNKIWVGYQTNADFNNDETNFVEFWLCVSCGLGDIVRMEAHDEPVEAEPDKKILEEIRAAEAERSKTPYEFYQDLKNHIDKHNSEYDAENTLL